jgi:hypothetical protein
MTQPPHSPRQRQRTTDAHQARLVPARIRKRAITHLQDRPRVAPYTHQGARGWKGESEGGSGEGVVRFCFGVFLDEGGEVAGVVDQLEGELCVSVVSSLKWPTRGYKPFWIRSG